MRTMMMGKKKNNNKSGVKLPSEIEENIFSRLPVKTILRFLSVCKSWYSLFHDPYFINMHNNNNNKNSRILPVLIKGKSVVMHNIHQQFVDPEVDGSVLVNVMDGRPLNVSFQRKIVGSHNGIVCVYGIRNCPNGDWTHSYYLCLWNPTLKVTKTIMKGFYPHHYNEKEEKPHRYNLGFGFHNNDFKVIRFQRMLYGNPEAEIYTLSSDSWRTVNVAPIFYEGHILLRLGYHYNSSIAVYINGAHHWAIYVRVNRYDYPGILSFDMGEEVFKENIIIPSECMKLRCRIFLFNYKNSLAMLTDTSVDHCPCIWVMKDYGFPESWTKLCKIDRLGGWIDPQAISWINKYVIIPKHHNCWVDRNEQGNLIVFNIDKSEVKNDISGLSQALKGVSQFCTYKESLFLLDSLIQ